VATSPIPAVVPHPRTNPYTHTLSPGTLRLPSAAATHEASGCPLPRSSPVVRPREAPRSRMRPQAERPQIQGPPRAKRPFQHRFRDACVQCRGSSVRIVSQTGPRKPARRQIRIASCLEKLPRSAGASKTSTRLLPSRPATSAFPESQMRRNRAYASAGPSPRCADLPIKASSLLSCWCAPRPRASARLGRAEPR